jgi:hypothetical protein
MVFSGRPVPGTTGSGDLQAPRHGERTKNIGPGRGVINHLSAHLGGNRLGQVQITMILSGGHLISSRLKIPRECEKTLANLLHYHRRHS